MVLRSACAIELLVGLAGCKVDAVDLSALCLKEHPGLVRCCEPDTFPSNGTCCPAGFHEVSDVEHEDWRLCAPDKDPCANAGTCLDGGTEADAGAPAP